MASISAALTIPRPPPPLSALRVTSVSASWLKRTQGLSFKLRCIPPPLEDSEKPLHEDSEIPPLLGISTYSLSAGLGTIGFLETSYLTYLKLTGSEAFCPVVGGSCSDVLNSDYSYVFGVPLTLVGMVAYGLVAVLALQQTGKNLLSGLNKNDVRTILLGTTTAMATASAYFLYVLSTKLAGASCLYCLFSAGLSFSLFFLTIKDFGLDEIRKALGLQLFISGLVVTALSTSYSSATSQFFGSGDITLEPYATEITQQSTPFAISLAKHLHAIGAKMYGAFWCSHCLEQKQMFGREAMEILDYIECFPGGAGKGKLMAMECRAVGIEGFPMWIINGKVLSGEQDLSALAEASGFVFEDSHPS